MKKTARKSKRGSQRKPAYLNPKLSSERRVGDLLSRMTLKEKAAQMLCVWQTKSSTLVDEKVDFDLQKAAIHFKDRLGLGHVGRPSDAGGGKNARDMAELTNAIQKFFVENTRLGIPVVFHEECLHGHAAVDGTSFPQPIGLAATFDPYLVRELFSMTAAEARARGTHQALTPVVDVAREPRWGRVEETYGEDPYLVSRMAIAAVQGFQGDGTFRDKQHVIATLKHFAAHGQPESGTNCAPANVSERILRETFLFPFQQAIRRGGAISIMASYNEIDGVPSHANPWLLRDVLRKEWGFKGYVVSDILPSASCTNGRSSSAITWLRTAGRRRPSPPGPESISNCPTRTATSTSSNSCIRNKVSPGTKVLYAPGMYRIGVSEVPIPSSALAMSGAGSAAGLKAEYFNNREMKGEPDLVRTDAEVNFEWGAFSPAPKIGESFSVRWTGKLLPVASGKYLMGAAGNGGMRIYVDGRLLVEELRSRRTRTITREVTLEAGRSYNLRFEYYSGSRPFAAAKLVWNPPDAAARLRDEAVGKARQADAVIMVLGISPQVEGEEMEVKLEGFQGGDRTDLSLPKPQEELLKAIHALGKPVVLVLLNGSPLSVNWADENVPAIIDAWYPGEEGGAAIADVLFGDYNPGGRLPVTFYKSVAQLPPFEDYSMQGRTYRYFKGEPLYPFGFGLSYSRFRYDNLKMSTDKVKAGEGVQVSADVLNAGDRAGDEVIQLYITDVSASVPVPIRSLAGFKRVSLRAGEKRTISFTIDPRQMSVIDDSGRRMIEPGDFQTSVGGKQPGFTGRLDSATTGVLSGRFQVVRVHQRGIHGDERRTDAPDEIRGSALCERQHPLQFGPPQHRRDAAGSGTAQESGTARGAPERDPARQAGDSGRCCQCVRFPCERRGVFYQRRLLPRGWGSHSLLTIADFGLRIADSTTWSTSIRNRERRLPAMAKIKGLRWWMIGLIMLGSSINYLTRSTLAVAAPTILQDLRISTRQYSYILGAFQGAIMLQPVCGYVLDVIGLRAGFAIFATVWSFLSIGHCFAHSWQSLAWIRGFLGLSEGSANPAGMKATAEWFPAKERGFAGGIYNIGASVGSMAAPPLVVWAILSYNWQASFVITGAMGLVWVVLWLSFYRAPEKHFALSDQEKLYIISGQEKSLQSDGVRPSVSRILRRRNFWGIALPRFLADPTWGTLSFWLPPYLTSVRHFNLKQIALFAWLPFLAADLGCLFGGMISAAAQRYGKVTLINARRCAFSAGACMMLGVGFVGFAQSAYTAIALLSLAGFAHQTLSVTVITMASDLFRKSEVATVAGMAGTLGNAGLLIFSLIIGALVTSIGYTPFFICLGALDLLGAAVLWTCVRERHMVQEASSQA